METCLCIERWIAEARNVGTAKNDDCNKKLRERKPQVVLGDNEVETFRFIWNNMGDKVERVRQIGGALSARLRSLNF